jgi:glycosyltransferase involved in cell wall biosynthesis
MRFHILSICDTPSNKEYLSNPLVQKVVNYCAMMYTGAEEMSAQEYIRNKTKHYLIHYGHEKSDVIANENVIVVRSSDPQASSSSIFTGNAIIELSRRRFEGDFILCFDGNKHKIIADMFEAECFIVEPGIGYLSNELSFAKYKIYETYSFMHYNYGLNKIMQPWWYDCVIPNYLDANDFDFKADKQNYYLYLGKISKSKGLDIIMYFADKMKFKLIIAGPVEGADISMESLPSTIEYVGLVGVQKRRELLSNAKAVLFLPTTVESFASVTLEAMMSGTPVITVDWGCFADTVLHALTGYRCRTLEQFEWAINNVDKIDPQACRQWAINNHSLPKVRTMYEEHFESILYIRFAGGFYHVNEERTELDYFMKEYPVTQHKANSSIVDTQAKIASATPSIVLIAAPLVVEKPVEVITQKRPRILIFTETKWAFGRIFYTIKKYSKKFDFDLVLWSRDLDAKKYESYDLIYVTIWTAALHFESQYPYLKNKLIFSGHGVVDFVEMSGTSQEVYERINKFELNVPLDWLRQREVGFNVVSHEQYDKFREKIGLRPNVDVFLTQCGADEDVFYPPIRGVRNDSEPLKVVFTFPQKSIIEAINSPKYDPKRKGLVKQIQQKVGELDLNIEYVFPDDLIPLERMAEFYHRGDVFLCISHSEGNPLGAFEAGACGLTVIVTNVGEMSHFIVDGHNGYLIDNIDDSQIMDDVIDRLKRLNDDRDLLHKIQANMLHDVLSEWTWKHKIDQWDNYFEKCIEVNATKF